MSTSRLTTDEAMRRAFWTIKLPSMALLFGTLLGTWLAMKLGWIPSRGMPGLKWGGPLFLLAFVGSWLVWSIQVPKWRLWTYERVDDIQSLKNQAVTAQIIWPDDSVFTRTELATRATWERIRKLEAENLLHSGSPDESLERTHEG
jgi:hypothetical protein